MAINPVATLCMLIACILQLQGTFTNNSNVMTTTTQTSLDVTPFGDREADVHTDNTAVVDCYLPIQLDSPSIPLKLTPPAMEREDVFLESERVSIQPPAHKGKWAMRFLVSAADGNLSKAEIDIHHQPQSKGEEKEPREVLVVRCPVDSEAATVTDKPMKNAVTLNRAFRLWLQIGTSYIRVHLVHGRNNKVTFLKDCTPASLVSLHFSLSLMCLSKGTCGFLRSSCKKECTLGGLIPGETELPVRLPLFHTMLDNYTLAQTHLFHYPTIDVFHAWNLILKWHQEGGVVAVVELNYVPSQEMGKDVLKVTCGEDGEVTTTDQPWNMSSPLLSLKAFARPRKLIFQVGAGLVKVKEILSEGQENEVGGFNCSLTTPLPPSLTLTMKCEGYNCGLFNTTCFKEHNDEVEVKLPFGSSHPLMLNSVMKEGKVLMEEARINLDTYSVNQEWKFFFLFSSPSMYLRDGLQSVVNISHFPDGTTGTDLVVLHCTYEESTVVIHSNVWHINTTSLITPLSVTLQVWKRGMRIVENTAGMDRTAVEVNCPFGITNFPHSKLDVYCFSSNCPLITQHSTRDVTTVKVLGHGTEQTQRVHLIKTVIKLSLTITLSAFILGGSLVFLWVHYLNFNFYYYLPSMSFCKVYKSSDSTPCDDDECESHSENNND
ncbi:hypothetical protein Pcinc_003765 [Petrolisthes cinctipes]|uniref:ZP domain-containing protein n=1 Tax=Petrolisthes cinctipes TaxID=88211 RepID=A0AAE1GGR4_PETCI|nr:hypothetical protein Pcinc_003765 [Petrolisthes cinctipes]